MLDAADDQPMQEAYQPNMQARMMYPVPFQQGVLLPMTHVMRFETFAEKEMPYIEQYLHRPDDIEKELDAAWLRYLHLMYADMTVTVGSANGDLSFKLDLVPQLHLYYLHVPPPDIGTTNWTPYFVARGDFPNDAFNLVANRVYAIETQQWPVQCNDLLLGWSFGEDKCVVLRPLPDAGPQVVYGVAMTPRPAQYRRYVFLTDGMREGTQAKRVEPVGIGLHRLPVPPDLCVVGHLLCDPAYAVVMGYAFDNLQHTQLPKEVRLIARDSVRPRENRTVTLRVNGRALKSAFSAVSAWVQCHASDFADVKSVLAGGRNDKMYRYQDEVTGRTRLFRSAFDLVSAVEARTGRSITKDFETHPERYIDVQALKDEDFRND